MLRFDHFVGLPTKHELYLLNKYDSFNSTCRYLEIYYPSCEINHLMVYNDEELVELLIYANKAGVTSCFNMLVGIAQPIIEGFIKFIFDKYPRVNKVKIQATYVPYDLPKSYVFSNFNDYVLMLPDSIEKYYATLGTSTRRNVKNYKSRLLRDFPQVEFKTVVKTEIEKSLIEQIINFNIKRMKQKGILPGLGDEDVRKMFEYAQHYGCVNYIEIDNTIVAGCLSIVLNKKIFVLVNAYDITYSKYNVGQLCLIYAIQYSIDTNLSAFHLLWGDNDYKTRFLAKVQPLYSYYVYRKYNVIFFKSKYTALLLNKLVAFRQSEFAKPIRETVKSFRKKI